MENNNQAIVYEKVREEISTLIDGLGVSEGEKEFAMTIMFPEDGRIIKSAEAAKMLGMMVERCRQREAKMIRRLSKCNNMTEMTAAYLKNRYWPDSNN